MSTKAPLSWFEIRTDGNGKVVSCKAVAKPADATEHLFFVRARDDRHASRLAFNQYMLQITQERHARYRLEGKCRCGRPVDDKRFGRCSICRAGNVLYSRRSRAKAAGRELPEKAERRDVIAARKDEERDAIRLETLRTVNRKALALPRADFFRWLQSEMEKLSKGRAA